MPSRNVEGRARARAELAADPRRSDAEIAGRAGVSPRLVMKVWAELEREGAIPAPVPTGHARKIAVTVRPYVPILPRMPDFSQGRCASPSVNADWWTSFNQEERQAAVHVCHSCLLREACAEWSLSLPSTDTTIYGGMTANERIRARRERAAAAAVA